MAFAQVFTSCVDPLASRNVPLPDQLEDGGVLVRVTAATVCGSDVHTIEGKRKEPSPLVLGHEGVGIIEKSANSLYPAGLRVTWSVCVSCTQDARCACCRDGLPQKCTSIFKYGHSRWDGVNALHDLSGSYSSHIYLRPGSSIVPLTGRLAVLPDSVVVPANCALATMEAAVERAVQLLGRRPNSVVIQGAGLLGIYGAALAAEACCAVGGSKGNRASPSVPVAVAVTDTIEPRLQLASDFGATLALNVAGLTDAEVRSQLLAHVQHRWTSMYKDSAPPGYDIVVEVCGHAGVLPLGLSLLRPGGVYVLVGLVHPASSLSGLTAEALIRSCAVMVGVHNYAPGNLERGLEFLARHYGEGAADTGSVDNVYTRTLPFERLVSPPVDLRQLPEAVELAKSGKYPRVLVTYRAERSA